MVRTYIRKTQRGLQYSKEDMANALVDIRNNKMSFHQAHLVYNIPRATLFTHLHDKRGKKSSTGGRSIAIPIEHETKLAEGLRCLEKWGFYVSKKEVQEIVSRFIIKNKIITPFKNNVPGQEWLRGFKNRHQLSIKKSQSIEYARKKICDPFLIFGFFQVLRETLVELELNDKPGHIWYLDETSISLAPYETKVFDATGAQCTDSSEHKNITVLSTASASGEKAAPLITFKENYVWNCWVADEDDYCSVSTSRAFGGVESDIFLEFLETTFLEAIGDVRPILLIYNGHKTYVNYDVLEFAKANGITILKFPAYSSHLLQPVFKTLYDEVDVGIATWQRHKYEISKKTFCEIVGSIWYKISTDVFQNCFREAGIYPFNGDVVSRDKFDQNSLKRWDEEIQRRIAQAEIDRNKVIQRLNEEKQLLMGIIEQNKGAIEPENATSNQYNYVEVSSEFLIKEENDSDNERDPLGYLQKHQEPTTNQTSINIKNHSIQAEYIQPCLPLGAYSSDESVDASSLNERLNCDLNNKDVKDNNISGFADTFNNQMPPSNHQRQYGKFGEYIADELSNLPPHVSAACQKLMNDVLFEAKCGNVDKFSQVVIRRKITN